MTQPTREEALAHFGVKGMHWGVRNARSESSGNRRSRKEVRALNKAGQQEFNNQKIQRLVKDAQTHGDKVLIQLKTPGSAPPMVVTGGAFIDHLSRGGAFDIRMTDVWAKQEGGKGPYVQNPSMNPKYQKIKR